MTTDFAELWTNGPSGPAVVYSVLMASINDDANYISALCHRLGVPGITDIHTHFMPHNVLVKVWDYFDRAGEVIGIEWPITYRTDEDERIETLRTLGVKQFTSLLYPHKPDMAAWLNSWSADFAARTPDCAHSSTFYPEPEAEDYVRSAIEAGTRVFKAHVQVGGYDPTDPLLDPVWGMIAEAELPIVIHAGHAPQRGAHTGLELIRDVMSRFPELTLVMAHLGMPDYDEFLDMADEYPNFHLDTCMALTDFTESMTPSTPEYRRRLGDYGDRIVFASDFPNIPYSYGHQVEALERLDLGEDWLRAVLWENGQRLLNPVP